MAELAQLLARIDHGDPVAAEQLLPLVYDELRKLAAARLQGEKPGQSLQATALVHEAYLRLVDGLSGQAWNGRGHFFAAAAEAMRRILVDQARRRNSLKRGGDRAREEFIDVELEHSQNQDELLALDEALTNLAATDADAARLVQLRYFAGLSMDEAADVMEISPRSAYYLWKYARAWLRRAIDGSAGESTSSEPI
jgi:RNA polymerase sigma factor (TIGR02999 family)